ncbi:hypothetical protein [Lichenihabitans psoromatis]|uniref:hypothetical protein n=1 Tax=Lichenihabitans psoromatis TaxID=2528642 RepID=UPI001FE10381|nr:hypothetical protein [Lichenihabitans psoromatis]
MGRTIAAATAAAMSVAMGAFGLTLPAIADTRPVIPAGGLAFGLCRALSRAVDAAAPSGPVFVASYSPGPGETDLPGPLRTTAFSYDNAVSVIALVACGDRARAGRIADAFVIAGRKDRTFTDGRIRNGYRAGLVADAPPNLPGWWDRDAGRWYEDAYQDGSATGNVAWVALALLTMHEATAAGPVTAADSYLATARHVLTWIGAHATDAPGPPGYAGGVTGFDTAQQVLTWQSTEHNIDVAAAAHWASRLTHDPAETAMATRATGFVASRFQPDAGFFLLGTTPEGQDAARDHLALDVQLWPVLGVPDAPTPWRRALGFADAHLRRGDGMTFAGFGTNRWTEGSAQASLAFRSVGADAIADGLLNGLAAHAAPSGLLYATSAGTVPTGLKVEAENGGDFEYFHRPHIGATAWATLAALRWNPFTGRKVN